MEFSLLIFGILSIIFPCMHADYSISDPLNLQRFGGNVKVSSDDYVTGSIWPKPQGQSPTGVKFALAPNSFTFQIKGKTSDVLTQAVQRYKYLTFPDGNVSKTAPKLAVIESLEIVVMDEYRNLTIESDETYDLTIKSPQSSLYAYEVWGALRGLETFSQLVYQDDEDLYYAKENKIVDYPRFHHRGFMIDTSRHYLKLSVILKFLDAMSYGKFNVLHWHVVDAQSFPFESKNFPMLSGQGAYNNKTHVYTPADVSKVIEYARLRGIRVVPEFDTPGHTLSWRSINNLLTKCYKGDKPDGSLGPINPTVDSNYDFLKTFFTEIGQRYPDKYIHLGGDEVPFGCWQSNPSITAWMKEHGIAGNYSLLEQYYEQRLLNIIASLGKEYIIWQEVVDNKVKVLPNTVVNIWKGGWQAEMAKVTGQLGLKAILSTCWYLNYISYGLDWTKYYQCEPTDFTGTEAQKELVIGGTGCMWGEWVDGTNILSRTWPRALAVAERLWSSKETTDLNDATMRIWEHRCRYLRRGIPAENAVQSKYCKHEWPLD